MSRTKYTLEAPADVTESAVEGHPYFPDEDGLVETYIPDHRDVLIRHGYVLKSEVAIFNPNRARYGSIDTDELGRSGITQALTERGVSFPQGASRDELAVIAVSWNEHNASAGRRARAEAAAALEDGDEAFTSDVAKPKPEPDEAEVAEIRLLINLGIPLADAMAMSPTARIAVLQSAAKTETAAAPATHAAQDAAPAPAAPVAPPKPATAAQTARKAAGRAPKAQPDASGKPDFRAMSYTPLQKWIADHGGGVSNSTKDKLIARAEELWATKGVSQEAI